jgi:mannose-6-phosphate isomerase-like protein (cupin superfamily)
MKPLSNWIAEGKIARFVAGNLDPMDHAMIFAAAKVDQAVRDAINTAKEEMIGQILALMKQEDPEQLIDSGMLQAYADGRLDEIGRQKVEWMAMAHPLVSNAVDEIKRIVVEQAVDSVKNKDPKAIIASTLLIDYVLGECSEAERREVEMASIYFPEVAAELDALRRLDAALVVCGSVTPPASAKARFTTFLEVSEIPADGWSLIMPSLTPASKPENFASWLDRVKPTSINPEQNLNVIPLEADKAMLTLFVVVKEGLDEEVHLDSIERFLVLEGSCYIEMADETIYLSQGEYFSVPKFTPHKVIVTSEIPCKLIVQQVAA